MQERRLLEGDIREVLPGLRFSDRGCMLARAHDG